MILGALYVVTEGNFIENALSGTGAGERSRWALPGMLLVMAVVLTVSLAAPLRPQGGDTVPGRLAMASLNCEHRSELTGIDWVAVSAARGKLPYYFRSTRDGRGVVSTFGPGPGWLGAAFFADVTPGSTLDDRFLRQRARWAAATAVAAATGLLALGLMAVTSWGWALGTAMAVGLSYAGAPTLAQGLWQQTACLPWLVAALAAALWSARRPDWLPVVVAAAAVAAWLRPPEAPLALSVLALGWLRCPVAERTPRRLIKAAVAGFGVSLALASYHWSYFASPWPDSQLAANEELKTQVWDLAPGSLLHALSGLLIGPARGWLWFAPFALLAVGLGLRRRRATAPLLLGILVQLLVAAAFVKWWGGLCFGPRLLGLSTWVAAVVPWLGTALARPLWQRLFAGCLLWGAAVGLLGAWRHDPRRWEIPRDPDHHPEALFDWKSSPWSILATPAKLAPPVRDAPAGPFVYCAPSTLRSLSR